MPEQSLVHLLGKNIDDAYVINLFRSLADEPLIKEYDDTYFYNFPEHGISFTFRTEGDIICSIFLYSDGYENYTQYKGQLPKDLNFSLKKLQVNELIGTPSKSGGNEFDEELNIFLPLWDKYKYDNYSLHITYLENYRVALVTLGIGC